MFACTSGWLLANPPVAMTMRRARTSSTEVLASAQKRMPHGAPLSLRMKATARCPVENVAPLFVRPSRRGIIMLCMSPRPFFGSMTDAFTPFCVYVFGSANCAP